MSTLASRKTQTAISSWRRKKNKGFLQKTCWYSRAQSRKIGWFNNCGSQSSQWRKWITQWSSICSRRCRTWPPNGSSRIRAERKLLRKHKGACFLEPNKKPKVIHTENSFEFGKSCEDSSWNYCTSTPHRSETNGIAERAVCRVNEGTSAVLLRSGLDNEWWADSMECYCYLWNIQDLLSDGRTPQERRFGPFDGPVIPFGAMGKTCRGYSNLAQKFCQVYSSIINCTRGESGKETFWSQILKNWRRWTHLKSTSEGTMPRKC